MLAVGSNGMQCLFISTVPYFFFFLQNLRLEESLLGLNSANIDLKIIQKWLSKFELFANFCYCCKNIWQLRTTFDGS